MYQHPDIVPAGHVTSSDTTSEGESSETEGRTTALLPRKAYWISRRGEKTYGVPKLIIPVKTPTSTMAARNWGSNTENQRVQEMLSVQLGPITSCFPLLNASTDETPFCRDSLHHAIQDLALPEVLKTGPHLLLMIQTQASHKTPTVATSVHSVHTILDKTSRQPDADTDEPPQLNVLDCILAKMFWDVRDLLNASSSHNGIEESPTAATKAAPKIFPYLALSRLEWLEDFCHDETLPWGATRIFECPGDGKRPRKQLRIYYGVPEFYVTPPDCDLGPNQRRVRLALDTIRRRTAECRSIQDLEDVSNEIARTDVGMDEVEQMPETL
ncbi:hypothetical protein PG984_002941 [Apiospora sp. TS-2023a]